MKMNRRNWNWKRRTDRAGEAGQVTVFFVLVLGIFLLGALSLAFDFSNMWFHRQAAQTAADAACAAGAMDILVDAEGGATGHAWGGQTVGTNYPCTTTSTDSVCKYAALNGYNSNGAAPGNSVSVSFPTTAANGSPPGVAIPPASIAGAFPFVRVDIVDSVQTFFLGLLSGSTSKDVRAFSTCGVELAQSPIPLVVLDPRAGDSKTLTVSGSPALGIYGGPQQSIQVNSPNLNSAYLGGTGCVDLSQGGPNNTGSDLGTWGGPASQTSTLCTVSGGGAGFDPGTTGHWLAPNPPMSDPFAQVSAPGQPTYVPPNAPSNPAFTLTPGSDPDCPVVTGLDGCDVWEPGYYSSALQIKGAGGTHVRISLFEPGIYYIATGGLQGAANSCIRPSSQIGDGSGGAMFYFADSNSVNIDSNSGNKCPASDPFSTKTGVNYLANGALCTAASTIPNNMPPSLDGSILLGPCQAPTGLNVPLWCFPNCGLNYGDPQGTSDPLGEQRGFLFFQSRAQNAGTNPNWQGGGNFLLAGTMYFHQCVTSGSDTGVSCSDSTAYNDNLTLAGNPGASTYILGQIIVDQLTLKGSASLTMDLNSQTAYNILKASIFQ